MFQINKNFKNLIAKIMTWGNEEKQYLKAFENNIGEQIHALNDERNLHFCSFCKHLEKSKDLEHYFYCSKEVFPGLRPLLPGIFAFISPLHPGESTGGLPWSLSIACNEFTVLEKESYYRNFHHQDSSRTIAYYEALEGVYLGQCRGQRPCSICASVRVEIYNECNKKGESQSSLPCTCVFNNISKNYFL